MIKSYKEISSNLISFILKQNIQWYYFIKQKPCQAMFLTVTKLVIS